MPETITTADVIYSALRKIGDYDQSETPSGDDYNNAELAFDLMAKRFVAEGADLFVREDVTLFLQNGQESYTLGATDHATTSFVETTISVDEASGQTALSVTSETGITVLDNVGVKLDDGSIHWSIASSLSPLTISLALPSQASAGNPVYVYTTVADRPYAINDSMYRRDTSGLDTPVSLIGEEEYSRLTDKDAVGAPVSAYYRRGHTNGELFVWPVDDDNHDKLCYTARVLPGTFPVEWGECLIFNLAASMGPEYGLDLQRQAYYDGKADRMLEDMLDSDVENASVIISMGR